MDGTWPVVLNCGLSRWFVVSAIAPPMFREELSSSPTTSPECARAAAPISFCDAEAIFASERSAAEPGLEDKGLQRCEWSQGAAKLAVAVDCAGGEVEDARGEAEDARGEPEKWRVSRKARGGGGRVERSVRSGRGAAGSDGARLCPWWPRRCDRWRGVSRVRQSQAVGASWRDVHAGELVRGGREQARIVGRVVQVRRGAASHCQPQVSHGRWFNASCACVWTTTRVTSLAPNLVLIAVL
jgi:hypothetical protein